MQSDQDLNGGGGGGSSGGTSRASNAPNTSRTSARTPGRVPNSKSLAPVGRGASSMLRTETEMGSVGDVLMDDSSGFDNTPRQTQRHHETSMVPTASSICNTSSINSGQSHGHPSPSSVLRYPTASHRLQYGTNAMPPTMPILSGPPPLGTLRNRYQGQQRSQSIAHAIQPYSGFSSNPPLTSPPRAYIPQSQNSYAHVGSYKPGPKPMNLNSRLLSPALNNSIPLGVQASHSSEGQGPSNSGYYQPSISSARSYSDRDRQTTQQGQQHGGLVNPHNLGKTKNRRPSQSSSLSSEESQSQREFRFPPLQECSGKEQSEGMRSDASQLHRSRATNIHDDQHFEVPPLPENHKQRIAVEYARFKRSVSGSISSSSTRLRAGSDAPSYDLNFPRSPQHSTPTRTSHKKSGMQVLRPADMSHEKGIVFGKKAPVRYYEYSEEFHGDGHVESDVKSISSNHVDHIYANPEEHGSTVEQEGQSIPTGIASSEQRSTSGPADIAISREDRNETYTPETANLEASPASSVAPRFTNNWTQKEAGFSTRGDTKSLTECLDMSGNDQSVQPDNLLTKEQPVPNEHVVELVHPAESGNNSGTTSLQTSLGLHIQEPSLGEQSSNSFNIPSKLSGPFALELLSDYTELKSASSIPINQEEFPLNPDSLSSPAIQVAAVPGPSEATNAIQREESPMGRRVRFLIPQQIDSHSALVGNPGPTGYQHNLDITCSGTQSPPLVYPPRDHIVRSQTTHHQAAVTSDAEPTSHAAWYGHGTPASVPSTGVQGDAATSLHLKHERRSSASKACTEFAQSYSLPLAHSDFGELSDDLALHHTRSTGDIYHEANAKGQSRNGSGSTPVSTSDM
ncbi:hypothetical protein COCVIDRAFT_22277 [Bipolaris victoriae FI3]|uniref:Uncharacterized protein n=1 Tax=Bipolaris victoriae (strain FI3) TaxID=930091 RepID=W7EV97_BIPV3|nr:hypothetical protein COCVIDRAFT_22277 [Bipolaris victoriae FI3]